MPGRHVLVGHHRHALSTKHGREQLSRHLQDVGSDMNTVAAVPESDIDDIWAGLHR